MNIRPRTAGCSKTETALRILGDHTSLTIFKRGGLPSKIVGTNSILNSDAARNILRERIHFTTGAILRQKRQWRRQGYVPCHLPLAEASTDAVPAAIPCLSSLLVK
jgi:hypothetical protein